MNSEDFLSDNIDKTLKEIDDFIHNNPIPFIDNSDVKNKKGRPELSEYEIRNKIVNIRLNQIEIDLLNSITETQNISASDFFRKYLEIEGRLSKNKKFYKDTLKKRVKMNMITMNEKVYLLRIMQSLNKDMKKIRDTLNDIKDLKREIRLDIKRSQIEGG
jgi:hypothetical protein